MTLVAEIHAAVARRQREGIEGWGLNTARLIEQFGGQEFEVEASRGCTSETCGHVSHSPADAVRRWVPPEGVRLIQLAETVEPDEWDLEYYAVETATGISYIEVHRPRSYWAEVGPIDMPHWTAFFEWLGIQERIERPSLGS